VAVFIDAIVVRVRDCQVANRPVYAAIGVTLNGHKDVLGLWMGTGGGGKRNPAKLGLGADTRRERRRIDQACLILLSIDATAPRCPRRSWICWRCCRLHSR
jgi:hypothetical protein